jgi:membrane protease subunit (stomatin/prohibitin family)
MSAETESYVSKLDQSDVYGIKADYDDVTGIMTIEVALADCEIANVSQTAYADVFNPAILQENSESIAAGIKEDLDMKLNKDGITITSFSIQSFSYPDNVWERMNSGK